MTLLARVAALSFALGLSATSAYAQGCKLTLLNSVALTQLGPGGRVSVPVSLNGVTKQMLLATAGGLTTLNESTVQALNLHELDGSRVRLLSGSGNATRRYVHVDKFQIGNMAGSLDLMVSPNPNAAPNAPIDGALAGDMMSRYDVEIDFAGRKLNYFAPNDCSDNVVYWPAAAVAVVPIKLGQPMRSEPGIRATRPNDLDSHIRVPVTLDGKNFDAVIDTGSANSTMSADIAKRVFGITADSPGSTPVANAGNDPDHKVFGHAFGSLAFAGVTVTDPHLVIRPNLIGTKDPDNVLATGSIIQRADDDIGPEVTIGMDVLKKLHLYIAYKERKLYVTPADAPDPAAKP